MFYEFLRSKDPFYFEMNCGCASEFPSHIQSSIEIFYVVKGKIIFTNNKIKKILKTGEAAICMPFDIHGFETIEPAEYFLLFISPEYINDIKYFIENYRFDTYFIQSDDNLKKNIEDLYNFYTSGADTFIIKGYLYFIFSAFKNKLTYKSKKFFAELTILQKSLIYIQNNYTKGITLNIISDELNVTRTYLSKLLNYHLGMSFNDYINMLKIHKAKELLRDEKNSIIDISFECGYENFRTFDRNFKKITGKTPKEYREIIKH